MTREVAAWLTQEDLKEFREMDVALRILESGAVPMTWQEASQIIERHRDFYVHIQEKYDLEDDELYEITSVTGVVFVEQD